MAPRADVSQVEEPLDVAQVALQLVQPGVQQVGRDPGGLGQQHLVQVVPGQ